MYFGPETYVPLASVIAGLTGLILTFWRRLKGLVRRVFQRQPPGTTDMPGSPAKRASTSKSRSRKGRRRAS